MLRLFCPCGHSVPLPENSGRSRCGRCQRVIEFTWFEGNNLEGFSKEPALEAQLAREQKMWARWRADLRARAFAPPAGPVRGIVKFIVTSQNDDAKTSVA